MFPWGCPTVRAGREGRHEDGHVAGKGSASGAVLRLYLVCSRPWT